MMRNRGCYLLVGLYWPASRNLLKLVPFFGGFGCWFVY